MPLIYRHNNPLIGIWKTTESSQKLLSQFLFKDNIISELQTIKSETRRQEWLAVRLLIEKLTPARANIIYINEAPCLADYHLNISISHTKGFAAVILTETPYPGIDIEYHSPRAYRLRERFLNVQEQILTNDQKLTINNKEKDLATLIWCAKETAFKALGQHDVDFKTHLHIIPFKLSDKGSFMLEETKTPYNQIFNINYIITDDYILTWKE